MLRSTLFVLSSLQAVIQLANYLGKLSYQIGDAINTIIQDSTQLVSLLAVMLKNMAASQKFAIILYTTVKFDEFSLCSAHLILFTSCMRGRNMCVTPLPSYFDKETCECGWVFLMNNILFIYELYMYLICITLSLQVSAKNIPPGKLVKELEQLLQRCYDE